MKTSYNRFLTSISFSLIVLIPVFCSAQDDATQEEDNLKPERPAFECTLLIDNQTNVVPIRKTLEFNIQHRFGTWVNGSEDFWGLWAPTNIRLALSYTPIDKLMIGIGATKVNKVVDLTGKYAILQQTRSSHMPVSLTYYVNASASTLSEDNFVHNSDRLSYFHQLIIARRFTRKISIQVSPSLSHFNFVTEQERKNDHFAIAFGGRYKFSAQSSVIVNIDQPITAHKDNNPHPNVSMGLEVSTGGHAFQMFFGNYSSIIPQFNNVYNGHDYTDGEFLLGFNIIRLWNF